MCSTSAHVIDVVGARVDVESAQRAQHRIHRPSIFAKLSRVFHTDIVSRF